ncbi:MAG: deoxyribodipyrimidine photo-lyase [Alphaproteobacteria bacterium]|nr:MAG: deoxyribodipyrimidine photo-lyase [Alphaproteobacteria bacterium]
MTGSVCIIVWLRQDLRISDNPALHAASQRGAAVVPLFILDEDDPWSPGAASRWWLHGSLEALNRDLRALGSRLILRRGPASPVLDCLIEETGATAVYWNRLFEPWARRRDRVIQRSLEDRGVTVLAFDGGHLVAPDRLVSRSGTPYRVFTPFWKALTVQVDPTPPLRAPAALPPPPAGLTGDPLSAWSLRPCDPDWAAGLRATWKTGEKAAADRLDRFLADVAPDYKTNRDRPGLCGTSGLSPHLQWGEISSRQVWHRVRGHMISGALPDGAGWAFLRELGWRAFCAHLLHHFPTLPEDNLDRRFDRVAWRDDRDALARWQRAETGYPIVDAGLRELWATGWMHNRVRMVVASFLVKHLLIDWRQGAQWFWDTLVDANLANNTVNWQWVAGSGADAAPYFRIFNPVLQGEKFDPNGTYVRRWIPELGGLPDKYIHKPWTAPASVLAETGVRLDGNYPAPMVDLKAARERALAAFRAIKNG